MKKIFVLLFIMMTLPSCFLFKTDELDKEVLFKLEYGRMDNEVLFSTDNQDRLQYKLDMASSSGLIYVSNGQARKITEFNSYGEMLLLYYDKNYNPAPVHIPVDGGTDEVLNRRAYPLDFVSPGLIRVTKDKSIFIEDRLPLRDEPQLSENGAVLDFIVKKMDRFGNTLGLIGQDGLGGKPFPFIRDMFVSADGELIVVTQEKNLFTIFWFSTDLYLLYKINFDIMKWPQISEVINADLDQFFVDFVQKKIMLKLDYYVTFTYEENSVRREPGDFMYSIVWQYDPEKGEFDTGNRIQLPELTMQTALSSSITNKKISVPYTYLGMNHENVMFFMGTMKIGAFSLIGISPEGKILAKGRIRLADTDMVKTVFRMTDEGVLLGLLLREQEVEIARWRTDWFVKTGLNGP